MEIQTYSSRFNASRAAKKLEGTWEQIQGSDGRWQNVEVKPSKPNLPMVQMVGRNIRCTDPSQNLVILDFNPEPKKELPPGTYTAKINGVSCENDVVEMKLSVKKAEAMHILIDLDNFEFCVAHPDPFVLTDLAEVFLEEDCAYSIDQLTSESFLKDLEPIQQLKLYRNLFPDGLTIHGPRLIATIQCYLLQLIENFKVGLWEGDIHSLRRQVNKNKPKEFVSDELKFKKFKDLILPILIPEENIFVKLKEILANYRQEDYNLISKFTSIKNEEKPMATPKQTPEEKEAAKAAAAEAKAAKAATKAAEKEAAKAAKEAEKAAKAEGKAVKAPRAPKEERNGTTRPGPGTTGNRIWEVIESESLKLGSLPSIKQLLEHEALKSELQVNVRAIYARYKKFNGLTRQAAA